MLMNTQDVSAALRGLARSFTLFSDKADYALAEGNRLADEQVNKAEQAALVRGWLDERDLLATPEETSWHLNHHRWSQAAEEIGWRIEALRKELRLTTDEVFDPMTGEVLV